MKIGLIGHGYWGKILEKNISKVDYIYDPLEHAEEQYQTLLENSNYVFIATPAITHYEIVKKCLSHNCHVFCEKPLTLSLKDANSLFNLAKKSKLKLHVDWIFTHHPVVKYLKKLGKNPGTGKLRKVVMNRMNLGPFRDDVSAKWDLASHDISILAYLVDEEMSVRSLDFESPNASQPGTCNILAMWAGGSAEINASWDYPSKCRSQTFIYDNVIIFWDDFRGLVRINGKNLDHLNDAKPLAESIRFFLEESVNKVNRQFKITQRTTALLEKGADS